MEILFTRHGESLANTLHVISNRDLPHPLTETGRIQAAQLADKLARPGYDQSHCPIASKLRAIYASPVPRALETARIVAKQAGLALEIAPALREYDCGILEGRSDPQAWKIHQQFFHDWIAAEARNHDRAPEGGETFFQIRSRLADFVNGLVKQYGEDSTERVLCVSHGGILNLGLPGLLTNLDFDFLRTRGLGHIEIVEAETQGDKLTCRAWGDVLFDEQGKCLM